MVLLGPDQQAVRFVLQIQLGDHVGTVLFNRSVRDKKLGSDLFIGHVTGDKLEDLSLGWSQYLKSGVQVTVLLHQLTNMRTEVGHSLHYGFDAGFDLL